MTCKHYSGTTAQSCKACCDEKSIGALSEAIQILKTQNAAKDAEISALRSKLEAMQCMQIDSESDKWKRIKPVPDKPEV